MSRDIDLAAYALIDVEQAREFLRIEDTDQDEIITGLVNEASAWMETETRRTLKARTGTMTFSGPGATWAVMPEAPFNSMASAEYRDADGTWTALNITGAQIVVDTGEVYLPNDVWWEGRKNIRVTGEVGFKAGTHDRDLKTLGLCCEQLVQILYQVRQNKIGRAEAVSIVGTGIAIKSDALPIEVKKTLAAYTRYV